MLRAHISSGRLRDLPYGKTPFRCGPWDASPSGRLPLIDSLIAAAAAEREALLVYRDQHLSVAPPEVLQGRI